MKKKRLFAIGDIHGCYEELMLLFEKLKKEANLDPEKDTVVFLGDYMDRGPDTPKVFDQLVKWHKKYPHWIFLYGNHEDLFVDLIFNRGKFYGKGTWLYNGGDVTWKSYGGTVDKAMELPKSHINFITQELKSYCETDDYFFVHAGVSPKLELTEIIKAMGKNDPEVSNDLLWIRGDFINSKKDWGKKIIFGHTADYTGQYQHKDLPWKPKPFMPILKKNKIGIDTAICPPGSKRLTAVELPKEKFYFQESVRR